MSPTRGANCSMNCFVPVLLCAMLVGCQPSGPGNESAGGCTPHDLSVEVNDGRMTVIWKDDCKTNISGYYIYVTEEPLVEAYPSYELPGTVEPFNHPPFPGDTDPSDGVQHFEANGLANGVKYYVSVRTVMADLTLSKPSNEVTTACGPQGEIELSLRYKADKDGYSFENNEYVEADNSANDLYFFSKDGQDYLVSPSQLDGFLRNNRLRKLKTNGDLKQAVSRAVITSLPVSERVAVKKGDWVQIITPENRSAFVKVLEISGSGDSRKIKLFFAYATLPGEIIL